MVGGAQKSSSTSAEGQRLLDGLAMGTKVLFHPNPFTSSAKKEKRQKVMRQPMSILANHFVLYNIIRFLPMAAKS